MAASGEADWCSLRVEVKCGCGHWLVVAYADGHWTDCGSRYSARPWMDWTDPDRYAPCPRSYRLHITPMPDGRVHLEERTRVRGRE